MPLPFVHRWGDASAVCPRTGRCPVLACFAPWSTDGAMPRACLFRPLVHGRGDAPCCLFRPLVHGRGDAPCLPVSPLRGCLLPYCLLPTCLLPSAYCLLPLPSAYWSLPSAYCLLPTTRRRRAELDQPRLRGEVPPREGLADPDAEGPEVLGTQLRRSRSGRRPRRRRSRSPGGSPEVEGLADLPADGPARQAAMPGPEGQVLDVLLPAAIGLQPDRGHHAGLGRR